MKPRKMNSDIEIISIEYPFIHTNATETIKKQTLDIFYYKYKKLSKRNDKTPKAKRLSMWSDKHDSEEEAELKTAVKAYLEKQKVMD